MCSEAQAPPRAGNIGREDLGGRGTAALGFWGQAAKDGPKVTGAFLPLAPLPGGCLSRPPTESPHIVRVGCTPARQAHPRLQGVGLQGWTPDGDQEGLSCQQGPWSCPSWTSQPATQGCVYTGQALLEGGRGGQEGGGNAQGQEPRLSGSAPLSQLCDLGRSSDLSGP